ncbi:phosphatase PAP2 family protein [Haloimpatiens massiliensis]|uniref:phosphatase PAP2 family protein n=1 Tax=Haloimpatiens massiliensis TaxID=1658110 RepID=UPI000C81BE09|nr:phosphatase PAP2 family protein [Haloimpatiens massiliensis]
MFYNIRNIFSNLGSYFDNIWNKYGYLIFGGFFTVSACVALFNGQSTTSIIYTLMLALAGFTAKKDLKKDVQAKTFLIWCVPIIAFLFFIQQYGYTIWGKILQWQMTKGLGWNWNETFKNIPFNDASFTRIYQTNWLNAFFTFVYNNGFVVPVLVPIYRAALCKDKRKMIRYILSAHVLQIFLISPFYAAIHLQEVWYVLGNPDRLQRNFTPQQAAGWTLNCFPSMHTSIAFAMFLVVLHEKDKIFKYAWSFFCLSVVYSTMYMEIHWVIDVIAGIVLALVTVKLVDLLLKLFDNKVFNKTHKAKVKYLYCNPEEKIKF